MIHAFEAHQPPVGERGGQLGGRCGEVLVTERDDNGVGDHGEVTFSEGFFARTAEHRSECGRIVVRFVADLSEDARCDITRFGSTLQTSQDLLGTSWIMRVKYTIADSCQDDGSEARGRSDECAQQRDGPQGESHCIDGTVGRV